MKKSLIFFICLFCVILIFPLHTMDEKRVLIFPYKNNGDLEYDYLSNLIPTYLFALFKDLPEYTAVSIHELKSYMKEKGFTQKDLESQKTRRVIIENFNADYIIQGQYTNKNNVLLTDLFITSRETQMDYRDMGIGEIKVPVIYTLDEVFLPMIEKFINQEMHTALLHVIPDHPCTLYVDEIEFGETPFLIRLYSGEHTIRFVYRDKEKGYTIHKKKIKIKKDEDVFVRIKVFVQLTITADNPCSIIVDGEERGFTPFTSQILSGKDYHIKVLYTDKAGTRDVFDGFINSTDSADISRHFSFHGSITASAAQLPFHIQLQDSEAYTLPYVFEDITPGEYDIKVYLSDPYWKTRWIFYDKKHKVLPYQHISLDMSGISYSPRLARCFLPSAAQFYNQQPGKGTLILSLFIGSATLTLVTGVLGYLNYSEYKKMTSDMSENGLGSSYTEDDISEKKNMILIYKSLLIGGFTTAGIIYIYSVIDGAIVMKHISRILENM